MIIFYRTANTQHIPSLAFLISFSPNSIQIVLFSHNVCFVEFKTFKHADVRGATFSLCFVDLLSRTMSRSIKLCSKPTTTSQPTVVVLRQKISVKLDNG